MGIMNSEEIGRQEDGADTRTGSRSATTTYDARASTVWHVTTFSQRRDSALSSGVTPYSARSSCVTPNSTCSLVFPSFSAGCSGLFHGRIFSLLSPPSLLLHLLRERVMFWCVSDIFAPCGPRWHEISPSCVAHAHTRELFVTKTHSQDTRKHTVCWHSHSEAPWHWRGVLAWRNMTGITWYHYRAVTRVAKHNTKCRQHASHARFETSLDLLESQTM